MEFIEKIEIAQPMEPKLIRADSLWSRISGNMFFSTEEKKKIRFMIETESGEDAIKKEENDYVFWKTDPGMDHRTQKRHDHAR